jgi:hypothetical protein
MKCRYHQDRHARFICLKMQTGYCGECFECGVVCTDPGNYCKFRSQCMIWETARGKKDALNWIKEAPLRT